MNDSANCDDCAIRNLLGRATEISDFGDLADLSSVFADDACWVSGGARREGRQAMIAGMAAFRDSGKSGPGSGCLHFHMPLSVQVNGDQASAVSHFALVDGRSEPRAMLAIGSYKDDLVRTADGWRISRREMLLA